MLQNVMLGADPELFLLDSKLNKSISAIGLIGGSKERPRQIGGGYAVQEDNVAVEFNIPPCDSSLEFQNSISHMLEYLRLELTPKGLSLDVRASVDFDEDQLDNPKAQQFGCEPDMNAWTRQMNPRPKGGGTLRSAGGHIHIGYENPSDDINIALVKAMDLFCGCASIMYDTDTRRREMYGQAGAHRIKFYGVEYRTLSNFWIKSDELVDFIYGQTTKAIEFVKSGKTIPLQAGKKIQACINTGDFDLLAELDVQFGIL